MHLLSINPLIQQHNDNTVYYAFILVTVLCYLIYKNNRKSF